MMTRSDPLNRIRVLAFDFDGTLATGRYDFARMRADVARLIEAYGLDPDALQGTGTLELADAAAKRLPPAEAAAFCEEAEAAICAVEVEGARGARLLPGAVEALQRLRGADYGIGVITRNCRAVVDVILDGTALACDVLLTREDVTHVKPHPEHLVKAMQAMRAEPDATAMVGDHPMDVDTARRAGVLAIGVLSGSSDEQALRHAGAAFVYADVVALADEFLNREA